MANCLCFDQVDTNKPPPGYVRTGVLLSLLSAEQKAVEGREDDHLADEQPGDPHVLFAEHPFEIRLRGEGLFRLLYRQEGGGRRAGAGFIDARGDEGFVEFDCCVRHKLEMATLLRLRSQVIQDRLGSKAPTFPDLLDQDRSHD